MGVYMYCKECGTEIKDGKFCTECGNSLKQINKITNKEDTSWVCPSCKTPLPGEPSNCPKCGKKIKYPTTAKNTILNIIKGTGLVIGGIGALILFIGIMGFLILVAGGVMALIFAIIAYNTGLPSTPMVILGFIMGTAGLLFIMFGVKRGDKKVKG